MSITLLDSPPLVAPVYNDMMYVVGSTLASQQGFKMKVELSLHGALLKTLKYDKWPLGDYFQVDVHRMLEPHLYYRVGHIAESSYGFAQMKTTVAPYVVKFTEEIDGNPISSGSVSATGYTFNGALKYLDWLKYDYTDYEMAGYGTEKFLTNSPRTLKIREDEVAELGGISRSLKIAYARVITYDADNNVLQNAQASHGWYTASEVANSLGLSFLCGPHNLSQHGFSFTNVHHYTVRFHNNEVTNDPISELFTFIIDRECSRHDLFRLHFLNRLGRFDSFTFKGSHQQTARFKRSEYQSFTGYTDVGTPTDPGTFAWTNNSYARGRVAFDTLETEQYTISTGWITEEESTWLQELAGSPAVLWQFDPSDSNGTVAVNITDDGYEVKKYANKKLFNLRLTMELAQPNYRQRA